MTAPDLNSSLRSGDLSPPAAAPDSLPRSVTARLGWRLCRAGTRGSRLPDRAIVALVIIAALALYLPRLSTPPRYLWDEILHAYTAGEYLKRNADAFQWDIPCSVGRPDSECEEENPAAIRGNRVGKYEWTHPPLGKEFIAAGIALLGDDAVGRRTPGVLFGAAGVGLLYLLARAITRRRAVALLAAILLLLDGLYFVQARLATLDIFGTVFLLGALLAFTAYLTVPPARCRWPLLLTGCCLGCGIATKWNAAYASGLIGLVVLARIVLLARAGRREPGSATVRAGLRAHLIWAPIALVVLPALLYIASYLPFFASGYGIADFVDLQQAMLHYHRTYQADLDDASRWWQWPLALQPAWYGSTDFDDGRVANMYALGNPLLYWAFLPAMLWLVVRLWRQRAPLLIVLAIGFFGQWLPWALIPRPAFTYHFLPAVPFGCLAVAAAVVHLWQGNSGWWRTLALAYVALVAAAFVFFFPLYAYLPLSDDALALRMWLDRWR